MQIALPVEGGVLSPHFGHCSEFLFFDVDTEAGEILGKKSIQPPPHEPGILPGWLREQGADVIIAGGMGMRAQQLFQQAGIEVVVGVQPGDPEAITKEYIAGNIQSGENLCDH